VNTDGEKVRQIQAGRRRAMDPEGALDHLQLEIMRLNQGIRSAIDGLENGRSREEVLGVLWRTIAGGTDDEPGMSGGPRNCLTPDEVNETRRELGLPGLREP
jgi:hypothetical protein